MTSGDQTILQWTYKPERFFEDGCTVEISGGKVLIENGRATGHFDGRHYADGREFRENVHASLQQIFAAQQVQVHEAFVLNSPGMVLRHADGRESVALFAEPLVLTVTLGTPDLVVRDASGKIVSDTKANRLRRQERFREKVVCLVPGDISLKRMLQSFQNAVADRDNLLIHLFEIRETLEVAFGGARQARDATKVSAAEWSKFGRIANDEPLFEGRHRGRCATLRPATKEEVKWTLNFGQRLIEGYVESKVKSANLE